MTEKETMFCEYMYNGDAALANKSIYYKIIHTPDDLLENLEKENKEECDIFHRYFYENDYWDNLKEEFETSRMLKG